MRSQFGVDRGIEIDLPCEESLGYITVTSLLRDQGVVDIERLVDRSMLQGQWAKDGVLPVVRVGLSGSSFDDEPQDSKANVGVHSSGPGSVRGVLSAPVVQKDGFGACRLVRILGVAAVDTLLGFVQRWVYSRDSMFKFLY